MKEQVLQAMREAGKPVSAGEVTKVLGADRKHPFGFGRIEYFSAIIIAVTVLSAGITEGTICYPAGYLNLTKEDVTEILKESM